MHRSHRLCTTLTSMVLRGLSRSGPGLGNYSFDEYKSEPKPKLLAESDDDWLVVTTLTSRSRGRSLIASGVVLARDLVNRPAFDKPPTATRRRRCWIARRTCR